MKSPLITLTDKEISFLVGTAKLIGRHVDKPFEMENTLKNETVAPISKQGLDPKFRELRVGEFGFMLADLETKQIHLSNLDVESYPTKSNRITTDDFADFVIAANDLFPVHADMMKIIEAGLKVHQGFYNGTF